MIKKNHAWILLEFSLFDGILVKIGEDMLERREGGVKHAWMWLKMVVKYWNLWHYFVIIYTMGNKYSQ
jgi:hypothetical protein